MPNKPEFTVFGTSIDLASSDTWISSSPWLLVLLMTYCCLRLRSKARAAATELHIAQIAAMPCGRRTAPSVSSAKPLPTLQDRVEAIRRTLSPTQQARYLDDRTPPTDVLLAIVAQHQARTQLAALPPLQTTGAAPHGHVRITSEVMATLHGLVERVEAETAPGSTKSPAAPAATPRPALQPMALGNPPFGGASPIRPRRRHGHQYAIPAYV